MIRKKAAPPLHVEPANPGQTQFNLYTRTAVAELLAHVLSGARLLDRVTVTASSTVPHGLGRVPQGWIVVSPRGFDWIEETEEPDATNLYLRASGAGTLSFKILVF